MYVVRACFLLAFFVLLCSLKILAKKVRILGILTVNTDTSDFKYYFTLLKYFLEHMPSSDSLCGACIKFASSAHGPSGLSYRISDEPRSGV